MQKILLILIIGSLICGCSHIFPKAACPNQPKGTLDFKNVKKISLDDGTINESGQINDGQQKGYSFKAKKGNKLSFKSDDYICIWVFTPSNDLLKGDRLPTDGNYILQISSSQGDTSFKLDIGFGSLGSISGDLNQKKAEKLVRMWLDSKPKIFAHPFDQELAKKTTTGSLYNDITKPNGSIDWLKKNNAHYSYSNLKINDIWIFIKDNTRPSIKLSILEDQKLYIDNNIQQSESGKNVSTYTYYFIKVDDDWKIDDYKKNI